jgi:chlorophyll synthase
MNDYYDRDIDAINEPYRPIPSGAISIQEAEQQIWGLLILGMALAGGLDVWCAHDTPSISLLCALGAAASYAYSVPSIKVGWPLC